jgi:endonuclease/exonuclease/phosphatase family metal-dependent hydrolase
MTLNRFPVQFCENYAVTGSHGERLGCLRTDLVVDNGVVLHVFNVHLGTSFIERRHQARKLLSDAVLNRQEYCGPKIVVGDFNEWTRGLASRLMRSRFEAVEPRDFLRPVRVPIRHFCRFFIEWTGGRFVTLRLLREPSVCFPIYRAQLSSVAYIAGPRQRVSS